MSFLKSLAATAAAAAVAVAALAPAPAAADLDGRDIARLAIGAAAIAIIANSARGGPHVEREIDVHRSYATVLPRACRVTLNYGHDRVRAYEGSCLRHEGFRRLPNYCAEELRVRGGHERFYIESCLVDAGYRTRGHGHH